MQGHAWKYSGALKNKSIKKAAKAAFFMLAPICNRGVYGSAFATRVLLKIYHTRVTNAKPGNTDCKSVLAVQIGVSDIGPRSLQIENVSFFDKIILCVYSLQIVHLI